MTVIRTVCGNLCLGAPRPDGGGPGAAGGGAPLAGEGGGVRERQEELPALHGLHAGLARRGDKGKAGGNQVKKDKYHVPIRIGSKPQ